MRYQLTKSLFVLGFQCKKALFLMAYKRHLAVYSAETQEAFKLGREFEASVKASFDGGIALDKKLGPKMDKYPEVTDYLLSDFTTEVLFEAGFLYQDLLVLADIVQREADGLTIYEIKNSTELKEVFILDASIQYFTITHSEYKVKKFNLILKDADKGYQIVDITDKVQANSEYIEKHFTSFKELLKKEEPSIKMGEQCKKPYLCPFYDYCSQTGSLTSKENDMQLDELQLDPNNEDFNYALQLVSETNKNVYLTCKAGTGKTTFLKYLRKVTKKRIVVAAPTGIAAINANGQTLHSLFIIPLRPILPSEKIKLKISNERRNLLRKLDLLVIDEISMVRSDVLDYIDRVLRACRLQKNRPFGGVQLLLIGDTFQLSPVIKPEEQQLLQNAYHGNFFFFNSEAYKRSEFIYIELQKIYRQKEQELIDLLNKIRVNKLLETDFALLNKKFQPHLNYKDYDNYVILSTTNRTVDYINDSYLEDLKTPLYSYTAKIKGDFKESEYPTAKELELKEGAQVIFLKNNPIKGYFNGMIAKVSKLTEKGIEVIAINKAKEGQKIVVEPDDWEKCQYEWDESAKELKTKVIGVFTQYPLRLAWAITVHKSQGMTLDKVIADVSRSWAPGQVYVALSRCTSFGGLILSSPIYQNAIRSDKYAIEFARQKTPLTLVAKALSTGKADALYLNARSEFNAGNYKTALNLLLRALQYRNDMETPTFERYIDVHLRRLKETNGNDSFSAELMQLKKDFLKLEKLLDKEKEKTNKRLEKQKEKLREERKLNRQLKKELLALQQENEELRKTFEEESEKTDF